MIVDDNTLTHNYYTLTDHLGSITHILDDQGVVNNGLLEERSFDAWGRMRNPVTYAYYTTPPAMLCDRGYSGHEHLTDFNVINMNGRLYDPFTGRMYSPDPVVADATSSQAYNKYAYVLNNPLKYKDPTGKYIGVDDLIAAGDPSLGNPAKKMTINDPRWKGWTKMEYMKNFERPDQQVKIHFNGFYDQNDNLIFIDDFKFSK